VSKLFEEGLPRRLRFTFNVINPLEMPTVWHD